MKKKAIVSNFGWIDPILVIWPNKHIFDRIIEAELNVVDSLKNFTREMSVEILQVRRGYVDNILYTEVEVMYVDERDKRSKVA